MRGLRGLLILASFAGFIIACGVGMDIPHHNADEAAMVCLDRLHNTGQTIIAIMIAALLAFNLFYLFWVPKPEKSKARQLIGLWFEAKERELKMRGYPKNSN